MAADNGYFLSQSVREAIKRELEKERIKQEILAAETARRLVLDSEAGREMRTERDMALRGIVGDEPGIFKTGTGVGFIGRAMTVAEERSLEERIAMRVEERIATSLERIIGLSLDRLGMAARSATAENTLVPFGQRSLEPKMKEVVPLPHEARKAEKKIVVLEKPDANHCGAKRNAAVLPIEQNVSKSMRTGVAKNTVNEGWSCALCQVNVTSKRALDEHVHGKKHRSKEAALELQNEREDFDNGLAQKKKAKCDANLCGASVHTTNGPEKKPSIEDWSCELCKVSATSKRGLDDHIQGKKHKSKEAALRLKNERKNVDKCMTWKKVANQKVQGENEISSSQGGHEIYSRSKNTEHDQKRINYKKENFLFWCETCHVGATSEVVMEAHRKGKKHRELLKAASLPILQILNTAVADDADDFAKDGEVESSGNVDAAAAVEVGLKEWDGKAFENVHSADMVKAKDGDVESFGDVSDGTVEAGVKGEGDEAIENADSEAMAKAEHEANIGY